MYVNASEYAKRSAANPGVANQHAFSRKRSAGWWVQSCSRRSLRPRGCGTQHWSVGGQKRSPM